MRVAVVNVSDTYNLGCEKLANWHRRLGDEVDAGPWNPMMAAKADLIYFSAIFTWHVPALIEHANLARSWGKQIEMGGPAVTNMVNFIRAQTGIEPHRGLDDRFEKEPGSYQVSFSSRGCPHKCRFCAVRRLEPVALEYSDYVPAPMLGDNNINASSWAHQEMVVDRLGTIPGKVDINSGFDIRFFTEAHFELYSQLRLAYWRFAFDSMEVEGHFRRVAQMMRERGFDRHQVLVYCLINYPGVTPQEALYRLQTIIDLGLAPYPMRFTPLNSLKPKYVAKGWSDELIMKMQAYFMAPGVWMSETWDGFMYGKSKRILAAMPLPGQGAFDVPA